MKQYTLAALQMAYLPVTMRGNNTEEACVLCWKSDCGCGSKTTAENDPFLNLTTLSEIQHA